MTAGGRAGAELQPGAASCLHSPIPSQDKPGWGEARGDQVPVMKAPGGDQLVGCQNTPLQVPHPQTQVQVCKLPAEVLPGLTPPWSGGTKAEK